MHKMFPNVPVFRMFHGTWNILWRLVRCYCYTTYVPVGSVFRSSLLLDKYML
jgi:hypothetical protein